MVVVFLFSYSPLVGTDWLYSGCVPTMIVKHHVPTSYILKFSSSSWKLTCRSSAFAGLCCALTVRYKAENFLIFLDVIICVLYLIKFVCSSDGQLIAVGTNEGSVYIANNLLKVRIQ